MTPRSSSDTEAKPERLLEQLTARAGLGERAHGIEALQRMLCGNLGMLGDERRVVHRRHDEPMTQTLRILERHAVVVTGRACLSREPALPEVQRGVRSHPPLHRVHHPAACAAAAHTRILEERDVAARRARLVGVEEVVDGRVVLVDRLLHHPEPENARVEVDVAGRVARDTRHVVDAVETHLAQPIRRSLGSRR